MPARRQHGCGGRPRPFKTALSTASSRQKPLHGNAKTKPDREAYIRTARDHLQRTADGAGTRSIAQSDPDTRTMGDVKTVDVAGSLFTNQ